MPGRKNDDDRSVTISLRKADLELLDAAIDERRGGSAALAASADSFRRLAAMEAEPQRKTVLAAARRDMLGELIRSYLSVEACFPDRVTIRAPLRATVTATGPTDPAAIAHAEAWIAQQEERLNRDAPDIVRRACAESRYRRALAEGDNAAAREAMLELADLLGVPE